MFKRIESILNSLGLTHQSYLKNFEDHDMGDDTVAMCFQNENDLVALKEVIPSTGHRMRFIRAFREQLATTTTNSEAANRSATPKIPPAEPRKSTMNEAPINVLPTQLDAVYKKALEEAKKSFEAEQMVLELAVGDGLGQYKTSMDNLLLSSRMTEVQQMNPLLTELPVPTDRLENFHLQCKSAALGKLTEFFKVNSEKFKKAPDVKLKSKEQLCGRIAQTYSDFKHRNALKSESYKAQVVKYLSDAQQEFMNDMKQLALGIDDEATLITIANELKSHVKSKYERRVQKSFIDETTWNEHLSRLDSHMDDLIGQHVKMIEWTRKDDESAVKSTMADARNFYTDQMKNARESKSWYTTEEFMRINDGVLEATVKKFSEEAGLTTPQKEILRQCLRGLHSRFEEENESFIPKESHAIGIDLGTTYSCVGVVVNGKVEIIQENEKFTIPSCVYYDEGNRRTVGEAAQDGAFMSPEDLIFYAKRLIGRSWNDQAVRDDLKQLNFKLEEVDGQPRIKCRAGILRPEEISAQVLAHLKSLAEKHLGQKVTKAVVTVPAYFNDSQRQATKDAAEIAGLTATILKEPVAAAIAYRLERTGDSFSNKNVLVFDLGGGTFDIAILTVSNWNLHVKTISGDMHLGGEDFDNLMVKHFLEKFKAKTGRDLVRDKQASSNPELRKKANDFIRRLKMECERKKRALSTAKLVRIVVEQADWTIDEKMTQEEFEQLVNPSLVKCMEIVRRALKEATMSSNDIHDVVLVGGSTKIPKVQEMLKEYFTGVQLKHSVNPDQAVAYGAAIQAAIKAGRGMQRRSVSGIKLTVQDVTPFSIGIKNRGGELVVQVPKGSRIPFSYTDSWVTFVDNQPGVRFTIFEGEDPVAVNNRQLGKFVLHVPSMKAGQVKMKSTTYVDDEGIVRVKAVCLIDGTQSDIVIDTFNGRMTRREIRDSRKAIEERGAEDRRSACKV